MNIIYSKKERKGLDGVYANPDLFNGDTESSIDLVYTDDDRIKQAYEKKGIEVKSFRKTRAAVAENV